MGEPLLKPEAVSAWVGLVVEAQRCARKLDRSPKLLRRLSRVAARQLTPAERGGESAYIALLALAGRWERIGPAARAENAAALLAHAGSVEAAVERRRPPGERGSPFRAPVRLPWRADVDG